MEINYYYAVYVYDSKHHPYLLTDSGFTLTLSSSYMDDEDIIYALKRCGLTLNKRLHVKSFRVEELKYPEFRIWLHDKILCDFKLIGESKVCLET